MAGCQLAEVGTAALGGHRTALSPEIANCRQFGLRDEIVGKDSGGAEQLAAPGGAVLRKLRSGEIRSVSDSSVVWCFCSEGSSNS